MFNGFFFIFFWNLFYYNASNHLEIKYNYNNLNKYINKVLNMCYNIDWNGIIF
jgi:hypothetical protein